MLLLKPQPGADEIPCHACEEECEGDENTEGNSKRYIGESQKTVAETVDKVEHGIKLRDGLPESRKGVDRVEDAAKVDEGREYEGRDDVDAIY